MERKQIIDFQNKQLRHIIHHAYHNVPYYRKLFDRVNLKPQDIKTIDDLSAVPITSKKDLQTAPTHEFISSNMNSKNLIVRKTGGSTGEPTTIWRSWTEETLLHAFRLRAIRYYGQRITDHTVSTIALSAIKNHDNKIAQRIQRFIKTFGFFSTTFMDCRLPIENIISKLKELSPDILGGYPGAMHRISKMLTEDDKKFIHPRFITVGGEVLTPLMHQQIKEAFNVPVYNTYNSHEFYNIAWQCKETGVSHVSDDSVILEVLKNNRPAKEGERGEVVGTCLHSFAMPLIRFRLGDIVTKGAESCKCGQPFSTIYQIQGRATDYFLLPEGRLLHPWDLLDKVYTASWIRQYRLIQERQDRIILNIVPFENVPKQEIAAIEKTARKILGESVEFQIIFVPEIPFEPNGKFRVSRSFIN
ncbi:MAG: hypothetical protein MUP22_12780 [Desulfobacterales bacterium]|nr:hypothetical protein [Desulfobacterales bacterium]